ncbi:MAG: AAA family ATPase, partial [Acidimicrobiia bacterium]
DQARRILGETRLLTVLAPGGTGKTRLAIQVAAELASDFPQGVYFVDLAPISSPDEIIQTVAESLGISLPTDADLLTQLLAYLGRKRRLLVFDNFEHVVAGAGIVTEILKGAPEVKVIATSRSKLNVAGETLMALPGLETEWERTEEALETSGVQLFVEAACRVDSSFALTAADIEPLGRILHMVDGMPLGIELAAAWVDALPLSDIADEIAKSLDFLETEQGGVPDRHRSMRAVFDYSWSMLGEDERTTFKALSVFRGGFTREAAEKVAGATIRNLAGLVSKSLLVFDRDTGRYSIHELLRQYAEAALQEDTAEWDSARDAHAAFFGERAAQAEYLLGSSDQKQALSVVEDDLDNIRAAWRCALARGDGALARKFIFALWFLHDIRGWHQAAVSLFGEALEAFDPADSDQSVQIARAASSGVQAWFVTLLGRPEEGMSQAAEAVSILSGLPDLMAYVMAVQYQCVGLMYLGKTEELHEVSSAAVRRATEEGDEWLAAENKTYLAGAEIYMGHIDEAKRIIAEGEAVLRARGEYRKLSMNLVTKAAIFNREKRPRDAIEILKDVVASSKEIGFRRMTQMGLRQLVDAYFAIDEMEAAEAADLESLAMSEEMGMVMEMAGMVATIASIRTRMGKLEEAVELL